MKPKIRLCKPKDIQTLAPNLREADAIEVRRSTGKDITEALMDSYQSSEFTWVVTYDHEPIIIYGLGSHPDVPEVGVPWMLATDGINKISRKFAKGSKQVIDMFHRWFPVLTNLVDTDNKDARRWLEWLGFVKGETYLVGTDDSPFIQYTRYK